ncbi:sulfurtransferase [Staphylospora marina]|uniref:sulfurtransferase n=1 Tax=Staphylospora marina TaxID=2490858 RepID=UPI000F5BA87C|nr:sulfurtransferase [Staphylospora marina]
MSRIVSMDEVLKHLHDPQTVIVDCRFVLGQPDAGREAYLKEHLPGSVYLDLERDLSGPVIGPGGRHPLPDPKRLAETLGNAGVDDSVQVIAYDDQCGAMASRLWWLLTWLGHPRVRVMNGTFSRWKEKGYPVDSTVHVPVRRTFLPRPQSDMLADADEVLRKLDDPDAVIIDSRERARWLGEHEPIDPVAGRIPGSKHCFWKNVCTEHGEWKSPEELARLFASVPKDKELIVYCGSGVTATPNVLALREAGYERVKLYAGSWSDWITDPSRPVKRGDED